jgi:ribonucleoside-triphosphate reductase
VVHLFIGEEIDNIESVKSLIKSICNNYQLPYVTLSPTFSVCPEHGYIAGHVEKCEKCGAENEVYARIVGYIRPIKQWNVGKKAEYYDRVTVKMVAGKKEKTECNMEDEPKLPMKLPKAVVMQK